MSSIDEARDAPRTLPDGSARRCEFWIDRGGTFTDLVFFRPDGSLAKLKLLSEAPERYDDAAIAGIRRMLGLADHDEIPAELVRAVRMGTTVATNALLERKGEPTALFITRGFRDQLRIGYQNRPRLFDRHIRLPELLYTEVVEVDERVSARGDVFVPLDEERLAASLAAVRRRGFRAVAIVFMHASRYPEHERRAADLARSAGFEQVSASHEVSPLVKLVARGDTTVADAYLSPVLAHYVRRLDAVLGRPSDRVPLYFMMSNGGLTAAAAFRGKDSILSGPAGGIVGMVRTALAAGFHKVIGFDMGGTSTDVSHFAGDGVADCEREFDAIVAGVRIRAPMLAIHTIAAGGGSVLHFDGRKFSVGPDSAGADPGPACYRRGGPLTVTDCNVLLGKIQPDFFPRVFGPGGDAALDTATVRTRFEALAREVSGAMGRPYAPEEIAEGFLRVAVANMGNAIEYISVQRGHDVTEYTLNCFGGAAGQHACLVADELGIRRIYVHPFASVLSALGMGFSDVTSMREQAVESPLSEGSLDAMNGTLERLALSARQDLVKQGLPPSTVETTRRAHLRYEGTDTALVVPAADGATMRRAFEALYRRRFSFLMPDRELVIEAVSVEAVSRAIETAIGTAAAAPAPGAPASQTGAYMAGAFRETNVYLRESLARGQAVEGPAIIAENDTTIVVEPGFRATVTPENHLVLERHLPLERPRPAGTDADPVLLEVFNNLFMSIAEQMGVRLANTAHSVNIKERLDFSCALFDEDGNLVANAPHMPVHLGSMSESIKVVMRKNAGTMRPGDVYALNDPYNGGTHLPDVTVVMPIFSRTADAILFYVAARGHHADIGGITPGSMPPRSRNVEEEGVLIDDFKLVEAGNLREAAVRALLSNARYPARNPDQNVADLRAQVAACEKGREELSKMLEHFGLECVTRYMKHVQDNAEESVRRAIHALEDGSFEYTMDDGAKIAVKVTVNRAERSAVVDFTGTSPELASNFNTPPAVVHAAVLYVFRTLVERDIPMNAGCLKPIAVVIPPGSMLSPAPPAATVAGNVETSQCITDALYGALGVMAASQGTMNNFTFGDDRYQYYETIAGGSGAGDGFDGTAAVQTHMTNSRMTDPEIIELRYPVVVEEHSIRKGSGGRGRFRGGDGALRRVRFLEPMTAAILAGHRKVGPYGLAGGGKGEVGATWVERADGTRTDLGHADEVAMKPGDVFVVSTPSGGGYGR